MPLAEGMSDSRGAKQKPEPHRADSPFCLGTKAGDHERLSLFGVPYASGGQRAGVLDQPDPQGPCGKTPIPSPLCAVWEWAGPPLSASCPHPLQGSDIRPNWPLTPHPASAQPKGPIFRDYGLPFMTFLAILQAEKLSLQEGSDLRETLESQWEAQPPQRDTTCPRCFVRVQFGGTGT